jgi:hypothetical protein
MKATLLLVLMLVLSPLALADDVYGDGCLELIAPENVIVSEPSSIMIQVLDENSKFIPGQGGAISITIRQNQTDVVRNAHPDELNVFGQILYEYNFTTELIGPHTIYISYQDVVEMGVFVSKFDLAKNMTEQQDRAELLMAIEHSDRDGISRQTMYQIASLGDIYQNMTVKQEKFSLVKTLNGEFMNDALQIIFYSLLILGALLVSSIMSASRPRNQKAYVRRRHT